jgi:hypothetical protein
MPEPPGFDVATAGFSCMTISSTEAVVRPVVGEM